MADTDSFINEVTEEVRRDRLYQLFRRWWWAGAVVIVGAVGGATYFELQRSADRQAAEAFGDAIIAALDEPTPSGRVAALEGITTESPEAEVLLALIAAAEAATAADAAPAAARLRSAVVAAQDLPQRYRDLALLKAEMLDPSEPSEARLVLGQLAQPGAPYAALASEQLALLDIAEGNLEAGLDALRALERSAAATPSLQQRAGQLIVALSSGATLVDTAPVEDAAAEPEADAVEAAPEPSVVEDATPGDDAENTPAAEETAGESDN